MMRSWLRRALADGSRARTAAQTPRETPPGANHPIARVHPETEARNLIVPFDPPAANAAGGAGGAGGAGTAAAAGTEAERYRTDKVKRPDRVKTTNVQAGDSSGGGK